MEDTQTSINLKQQLAQSIETYAAARTSGDQVLMQFAAERLQQLLESITISIPPNEQPRGMQAISSGLNTPDDFSTPADQTQNGNAVAKVGQV